MLMKKNRGAKKKELNYDLGPVKDFLGETFWDAWDADEEISAAAIEESRDADEEISAAVVRYHPRDLGRSETSGQPNT